MSVIAFEVGREGGIFRHGPDGLEAETALDELLDGRESGRLSLARYTAALKSLGEQHPTFIDALAHLGFTLFDQGKPKLALAACQEGYSIGEAAIPSDFDGTIEWGWLENRPFLRAAQGIVLSYKKLGRRREAIALMERLLHWNPSDNQGFRFLIGSDYLRSGSMIKAARIMKKEAEHYPPYQYELALVDLIAGRTVPAATRLRQAFTANGYIAEMLCGMSNPLPLAIWHGSNLAEPETAHTYVEHCGDLWNSTPAAIPFLRWLHTHPKVLAERACIYDVKEQLLWEHEFAKRRKLVDQQERLLAEIDDTLSKEIVVKMLDRHNRPIEPWLYPATQSEVL
jgi:tetratricopeptide (TPR) repeat protein